MCEANGHPDWRNGPRRSKADLAELMVALFITLGLAAWFLWHWHQWLSFYEP